MLGSLLAYIRESKGLSKTTLADMTGINVGHLTHIEKGERNPSQSALRDICKALEIPYQQISNTYDKKLDEDQIRFGMVSTVPYNTVPLVKNIEDMIICPTSISNAAMAFIMQEDTMKASIPKGSVAFLELNSIPAHREIGLFKYEGKFLVRRILYRKNKIILKADSLLTRDIVIERLDRTPFITVGKVYGGNS